MERIELSLSPQSAPSTFVTVTPNAVTVKCGFGEPISTSIDTASWRKLIKLLEKRSVWKWPRNFHNPMVLDGLVWSLVVQTTDINVYTGGTNAYPPRGNGPHWGHDFGKLVDTISEMAGDAASHFQNISAEYRRMSV